MSDVAAQPQEIREAIRNYLLTEFLPGENPGELTDSTPLITGGILDSIGVVKLVSFLEDRYDIQFKAHEVSVENLDTIDLIVDSVTQKRKSETA